MQTLIPTQAETVPSTETNAVRKVVINPREALLCSAMEKGLVETEVIHKIRYENHVKYVFDVRLKKDPTGEISSSAIRMMILKRFSEFKSLRETLLIASIESNQDVDEPSIPNLPSRVSMSLR
jgi:hypothetical protein